LTLRVATRGSALARWQADHVGSLVGAVDRSIDVELVIVDTAGDRRQDIEIWQMGGKGVFVKEVQAAVLAGRADIAVHSAKDLPSRQVDGLVLAAVPARGEVRDALVGSTLAAIPTGGRVATGSARRRSQLADQRPDLTFANLRGNIPTRLERASEHDAAVIAAVALERLGRSDAVTELLSTDVMLPQVGQGALAVECREDDELRDLLAEIEHGPSRRSVDAERAFLEELGGDCDLPAGALAHADDGNAHVEIDGLLASLDGRIVLRARERGTDPIAVGGALARHLLDGAGGREVLAG